MKKKSGMKSKITFLLVFLLMAVNIYAADGITVHFDVRNALVNHVVLVYHQSVNEYQLSDGKATVQLDGMDALYAKVYYGEKSKDIYLQKGDDMTISFDGNDFDNSFAVKGGNEKAVDYLNKIQVVGLPDQTYALPWNEFKQTVISKIASMKRLLKVRKFSSDDKFQKMEEGRITYFYANAFLMYPVSHLYLTQDTTMVLGKDYDDTLREYVKEDADLADIDEYRNYMIETSHVLDEADKNIRQYYPKVVAEMSYIGEHFENEKVRESLMHHLAFTYVEGNGTDGITDLQNLYYTYVTSPYLNAIFKQACDKWDKAAVGRPSPDFKGVDVNGKELSLRDFLGKYVYIDMWATWCGPCQKELPFLKKLEAKYKDRNIAFVGLSIDADKAKWEERVKSGALCGTQIYIGRGTKFQGDYRITGIPRFILLDPRGRIVNPDMTRPSSEDTEKILDSQTGL